MGIQMAATNFCLSTASMNSLSKTTSKTGVSQPQAAKLLRVSLSTYQGWEQRRPTPFGYILFFATHQLLED
ncbi:helix-turn-helix domain-containing protein [Rhizobium indicum]|uniref:helix-turn-helix domain-containing protein n=1 Tax=Rhizobium indicum TaxID=2583231 RepID=UPI001AEDE96E|nr:hypothetical protein [Rhizobium indicum]